MIEVVEDFLPEATYKELQSQLNNPPMRYGWKSSTNGSDPHGHWNLRLTGGGFDNLADISDQFPINLTSAWNHIKQCYPSMTNTVPIRCYMNGATYGVDGYFHTDSTRDNEKTIVIYMNDDWHIDWAGETVIVDENKDIIKSVLPKRNRAVIFPGKMSHCARGVSRKCFVLRKTLMIKTREIRSSDFEKLSSFLYKAGAFKKSHKNGSLHDHLVRVYQILEDNNFDKDICFGGGLHSVFGTSAYKDNIFTYDETPKLEAVFGSRAVSLATMFSSINRPTTLETPLQQISGDYLLHTRSMELLATPNQAFDALRAVECANLIDQNSLNKETYPNLYNFWQNMKSYK